MVVAIGGPGGGGGGGGPAGPGGWRPLARWRQTSTNVGSMHHWPVSEQVSERII